MYYIQILHFIVRKETKMTCWRLNKVKNMFRNIRTSKYKGQIFLLHRLDVKQQVKVELYVQTAQ